MKLDTTSAGIAPFSSMDGSNIQILIIVISVAVAIGFVTCVVSHYKMGARSWSEQHHQRHQNHQINNSETTRSTYNNHSSFNQPFSAVLCVPPSNGRRIKSNSVQSEDNIRLQNNLVANYPPAISMPDGEELPYGSFKNVRIRNEDQQSEIYQECVKPPPNKTIFDGASSLSYDSKSVGFLHAKKGSRNPCSSVRDDRTPLVMPCHSMSSTGYPRPSATSVNSNSKKKLSVLVIPSRQSHKSQSTSNQSVVQHCTSIASQIPSTSTITMTNSEPTVSSCASGNRKTVIRQNDSPPDYSEVVANPSLYHITATNGRHLNGL